MATFGQRFKMLRLEKDMKQEELIDDFNKKYHYNFTKAAVSQYENDKRIPEVEALKAFAEYFNVSVDFLLGTGNDRKPTPRRFIGSRLRTLRANRTLEEYSKSIYDNTGVEIIPQLLEYYEKGKEIPEIEIAEVLAASEGIDVNYFYDVDNNKIERKPTNYRSIDPLYFMSPEIREWVKNPDNYRYIEFIYNSYKNGMRLEKK